VSGGATRAARGRDEGDTSLRDGKDDDTRVGERRRNEGGKGEMKAIPRYETAMMTILASVSGGATRAARAR
jgi:hypothetical protein